jgi:double stranded RNA-specific editase B
MDKNPVMLLNELRPGLAYDVRESGDSPSTKRFIMTVTVEDGGEQFEGSGASKKLAKQACARAALTKLYNMSFTPHMQQGGGGSGADGGAGGGGAGGAGGEDHLVPGTSVSISEFSLPQGVCDRIGKQVMDRFAALMEGHAQHSRRKVLAGVVMTTDLEMEHMKVISVSTGTKCVNGEHMSVNGNSLNGKQSCIVYGY